jgi:anti-sigma factor RsiW
VNCEETQRLLHAYIDAELDAMNSLAVEQHLQGCAACTRDYESYQALRMAMKGSSLYFQAPTSLQKRVQLSLPKNEHAFHPARQPSWLWLSAAALLLLLLGGFGFWGITQLRSNSSASVDSRIAQAVVDSHERSLVGDHLVDILSSDPNILKTWFESKLGYSPPVADLKPQGFTLVGGRLDFLDNQTVAAIVYKCGKHVVTLFAWPATQNVEIRTLSLQGYYVTHWAKYGMNCWAVADLDENQLQQFAHLIGQHIETLL